MMSSRKSGFYGYYSRGISTFYGYIYALEVVLTGILTDKSSFTDMSNMLLEALDMLLWIDFVSSSFLDLNIFARDLYRESVGYSVTLVI